MNTIPYLPCQAEQKINSFFVDFTGEEREPIDPRRWIENCEIRMTPKERPAKAPESEAEKVAVAVGSPANANEPGISVFRSELIKLRAERLRSSETRTQKAIDAWRSAAPGEGNEAFFRLGASLQFAGMEPYEIENILVQEARSARSPEDRRRQIPGILASLGKNGRRQRSSACG